MSTSEQIDDFASFARRALSSGDSEASIDELYERWRQDRSVENDALAVRASLRDLDRGERGRPADEFLDEARARLSSVK